MVAIPEIEELNIGHSIVSRAVAVGLEQAVREMFAGQPFMEHLGAELGAVRPGYAEIRLPYRTAVTQHDGYFHGGVIATLADNSGGAAGYTVLPPGKGLLTVEFKINILAPGRGEALIARGRVVRPGRRLIIGGAAGALLGRQIDGGRDRTLGTLLGAVGGALRVGQLGLPDL